MEQSQKAIAPPIVPVATPLYAPVDLNNITIMTPQMLTAANDQQISDEPVITFISKPEPYQRCSFSSITEVLIELARISYKIFTDFFRLHSQSAILCF